MNLKRVHFGIIQFSNKHTEIFGTFIEILKKYNWPLTIYYNLESDEYTILKYYEKVFGKLDIRPISKINYDLDINIIASSSDYKNNTSAIEQIAHKSIFIHHQKFHHRPFMKKTITVSPVIQTAEMPTNEYILPVYRNYKHIHYKSSYSSSKLATVASSSSSEFSSSSSKLATVASSSSLRTAASSKLATVALFAPSSKLASS